MMTYHVQFLLLVLAGWGNRHQQDMIEKSLMKNRKKARVPAEVMPSDRRSVRCPP